jgi:prepilin-type processing-associated H-X9-DG protein
VDGPGRSLECRRGFARLELLIVVGLILLLFTLYWGSGASGRRREQQRACTDNLQKIFIALQIYGNEHEGRFPAVAGARTSEEPLNELVPRYTIDTPVFICPGSKDAPLPAGDSFRQLKISYAYYMGRRATDPPAALMSDRQLDTQPKESGQLAFSSTGKPPGNNHEARGGNFLFSDGHVEFSAPQVPFALGLTQGVVLLNPKP